MSGFHPFGKGFQGGWGSVYCRTGEKKTLFVEFPESGALPEVEGRSGEVVCLMWNERESRSWPPDHGSW